MLEVKTGMKLAKYDKEVLKLIASSSLDHEASLLRFKFYHMIFNRYHMDHFSLHVIHVHAGWQLQKTHSAGFGANGSTGYFSILPFKTYFKAISCTHARYFS